MNLDVGVGGQITNPGFFLVNIIQLQTGKESTELLVDTSACVKHEIMIGSIEHHSTFLVLYIRCFDIGFDGKLPNSLSERDILQNFSKLQTNKVFCWRDLILEPGTRFR